MHKLDNAFLEDVGLGALPQNEKNPMLQHIYEELELRVGVKLASGMTKEQLDEFEKFMNQGDQEGALNWLSTNFPDYKQVVSNELENLRKEIAQNAPMILATFQQ
jgi:Protein of unknown function (DUF5663)